MATRCVTAYRQAGRRASIFRSRPVTHCGGIFGLRVSLQEIAEVGWSGLIVSVLVVTSTLLIGLWCGMKVFKLDRDTALLTAAGSAICGAAAVLAFESALRSAP